MAERLVLCTDLDGTVVPDGRATESSQARPTLTRLAARPEVILVYVSGRDCGRIATAIDEHQLPVPDYAIADVGTTIYSVVETARGGATFVRWHDWSDELARDWGGRNATQLAELLGAVPGLRLQEPDRQGRHKLSFYADLADADLADAEMAGELTQRLRRHTIAARQIWSRDAAGRGLVDLLPRRAGKLAAIRRLMDGRGFGPREVVFAGDSGNDLDVLTSGLAAVLVANSSDEVRRTARQEARRRGCADRLYLASGGFLGMNGNYAAGVLEGLAHFDPDVTRWLAAEP